MRFVTKAGVPKQGQRNETLNREEPLLGFSDSRGTYAQNRALSHDRAKKVEDELSARGVHTSLVDALGQETPLSSNVSDSSRERNRRVEVWLR